MAIEPGPLSRGTGMLGSLVDREEAKRIERMGLALSSRAPPWAAKYVEKMAPVVGVAVSAFETVAPYFWKFGVGVYNVWRWLPHRATRCLYGVGICFFGGRYAVGIAAIEAFQSTGGGQMISWCNDIADEAEKFWEASKTDDLKDEDNDGVADVEQIGNDKLATRKAMLWLKVANPEKIQAAMGGLWSGYMGVLVALKFEFARTTALAHSIGDQLRPVTGKVFGPLLVYLIPKEYQQWVNPMINVACKAFASMIAWKIQQLISTVQSGMKGGSIVAETIYETIRERGWVSTPVDETMIDDVFGWVVAGAGIYTQIVKGGIVPFPFYILLWPLDVLEVWLKWNVTWLVKEPDAKK